MGLTKYGRYLGFHGGGTAGDNLSDPLVFDDLAKKMPMTGQSGHRQTPVTTTGKLVDSHQRRRRARRSEQPDPGFQRKGSKPASAVVGTVGIIG